MSQLTIPCSGPIGRSRAIWHCAGDCHSGKAMRFMLKILRNLRNHSSNTDLYTEAPVPSADNLGAANGKQGSADMYKGSSTVGVKFKERFKPEVLPDVGGIYRGTTRYGHESNARPRIENGKVDLRNAPDSVKAGELKPFGSLLKRVPGTA